MSKQKYMTLTTHRLMNHLCSERERALGYSALNDAPDDVTEKIEHEVVAELRRRGLYKLTTRQPSTITRSVERFEAAA